MSGRLNHTPAQILRQLLLDLDQATVHSQSLAWPITHGGMPDSPDNALSVRDTEGRTAGRIQTDGEVPIQHGIQVRVRGGDEHVGFEKASDLATFLDTQVLRSTVVLNESTYKVQCVTRIGDVIRLGTEPSSRRYLFTINGLMAVRLDSEAVSGTGT